MSAAQEFFLLVVGAIVMGILGAMIGALLNSPVVAVVLSLLFGFCWGVLVAHIASEVNKNE